MTVARFRQRFYATNQNGHAGRKWTRRKGIRGQCGSWFPARLCETGTRRARLRAGLLAFRIAKLWARAGENGCRRCRLSETAIKNARTVQLTSFQLDERRCNRVPGRLRRNVARWEANGAHLGLLLRPG